MILTVPGSRCYRDPSHVARVLCALGRGLLACHPRVGGVEDGMSKTDWLVVGLIGLMGGLVAIVPLPGVVVGAGGWILYTMGKRAA